MSYEFDEEKRNENFSGLENGTQTVDAVGYDSLDANREGQQDNPVETADTAGIDAMDPSGVQEGEMTQSGTQVNAETQIPQSASAPEPEIAQMQLSEEGIRAAEEKGRRKKEKKDKKPMNAFGKSALNGVVFGLCGALAFSGFMVVGNKTFLKKAPESAAVESAELQAKATEEKEDTKSRQSSTIPVNDTKKAATISEITKATMPSIVSITVKGVEEVRGMFGTQSYESEGAGSGIVVSESDDAFLIATNNHVVSNAEEVSVCFDDSSDAVVAAKVCGTDAKNDLAIVSVKKSDIDAEVLKGIKAIKIGSSEKLNVGDQVVAIGNALGYGQSVTTGIVSALDREVEIENMAAKLIQTDAAINPGNSGGALLNMNGELIGINSAKFASSQVEGMGYAIPIDTAKPILDKLMNRASMERVSAEEAGFLGVTVQEVSSEASASYGIPEGAYIGSVEEGSAAEKAGLKKGDVITKFDGIGISGPADLKEQVSYYKQGSSVEVTYMRMNDGEYEEKTVKVTLGASEAAKKERIEDENKSEKKDRAEDQADEQMEDPSGKEAAPERPETPQREEDAENGQGYDQMPYGYDQDDIEEFFYRFFGQPGDEGYEMPPQKGY